MDEATGQTKEQKEKTFDHASDVRKFEIDLFWKRSLFFWTFIGAALVAYAALMRERKDELPFAVACFGGLCSLAWTLANRGSKFWQETWENKQRDAELGALGVSISKIPANTKREWWGPWRYSVSRLTISVSDLTFLVWIFLGFRASPSGTMSTWPCAQLIVLGVSILYGLAILWGTRSKPYSN